MAVYDISKYKKDKQDHIDDFEQDSGIEVIDHDIDSLAELEDENDDFQQMTYKQRKVSNAKSEELFGMDNVERYNAIKSTFLKNNIQKDDTITIQGESNIIVKNDDTEPESIDDYDNKINIAKDWSDTSMITIITPRPTALELEELWSTWNNMHLKHRRDSDNKSRELFNLTNKEHYENLKSIFLKYDKGIVGKTEDPELSSISISTNGDEIYDIGKIIESSDSSIVIANKLIELNNIKTDCIFENKLISDITDKGKSRLDNDVNLYYDNMINLPFFLPDEMIQMGVYGESLYNINPDSTVLAGEITTKDWFTDYQMCTNGFKSCKYNENVSLWINKLNVLYNDFSIIKESGDRYRIDARKQSILELGWNPEIEFSIENRIKASDRTRDRLKLMNQRKVYDIRESYNESESGYINESLSNSDKFPLFIVLSFSGDTFSKTVQKWTNAIYSHSAVGVDVELDKLYSYNIRDKGFAVESLNNYRKRNSSSTIAVYVTFLTKEEIKKVKFKLDYFLANKKDTGYSFLNILGIGLGKDVERNNNMICSQFVDRILKMVNMDITNKPSGLVAPNDFYITKNSNMYQIYEGPVTDYNVNKTSNLVDKLQRNSNHLNENVSLLSDESTVIYESILKPYTDIYYYNEAKEFPVQFDNEGNLLIRNMKSIDIEAEYAQSHKLLKIYEQNENIEGMKYELSKLWFLNSIVEKKIYNERNTEKKKQELYKVRARILNDFNKYLKMVTDKESDFNFTDYYNNTPFSDATIKINKSTIKHGAKLIKLLPRLLV